MTDTQFLLDRRYHVSNPQHLYGYDELLQVGNPPCGHKLIFQAHRVGQLELLLLPSPTVNHSVDYWIRTPGGKQQFLGTGPMSPIHRTRPFAVTEEQVRAQPNRYRIVQWGCPVQFVVDMEQNWIFSNITCEPGGYMPLPMRSCYSTTEYILL